MSGMSIVTYDRHIELDIKTKEPFDRIWAFHHREAPLLTVPDSLSDGICCPALDNDEMTLIPLSRPVEQIRLCASVADSSSPIRLFTVFPSKTVAAESCTTVSASTATPTPPLTATRRSSARHLDCAPIW